MISEGAGLAEVILGRVKLLQVRPSVILVVFRDNYPPEQRHPRNSAQPDAHLLRGHRILCLPPARCLSGGSLATSAELCHLRRMLTASGLWISQCRRRQPIIQNRPHRLSDLPRALQCILLHQWPHRHRPRQSFSDHNRPPNVSNSKN